MALRYSKTPEIVTIYLSEKEHPLAYSRALRTLMANDMTEQDARDIIKSGFVMEVVYEPDGGLFAVETETISSVISPYSGEKLMEQDMFGEVRNDYHDDDNHYTTIDAWETEDDSEEGRVVAVVHDSGDVFYVDNAARNSDMVRTAILEVKQRLGVKLQ